MILECNEKLVFLGVEQRNGQKGTFELVRLGDPVNFENYDFFKRDDLNITGIDKGTPVMATLQGTKRGYNLQLDLIRVTPVK